MTATGATPLVVAAHGTASPEGRGVIEACAAAAAHALGVEHRVGYVDVCGPTLEESLTGLVAPVVVPLFLASGYHVRHDVPTAVRLVPDAVVTPALGVEEEVLTALVDRVTGVAALLPSAGRPGAAAAGVDGVVVTAAGSSVEHARAEVAEVTDRLGERLGAAAVAAYLTGPGPRPEEEVRRLRAAGRSRVVLATHLLSPGHFHDRLRGVGRRVDAPVTEPLATHPALAELVVRRYRSGVASQA